MENVRYKGVRRHVAASYLLLLAWSVLCSGQGQAQPDRNLKILYLGRPGSSREKDFVRFLTKYFDVVQTSNLKTFGTSEGADTDPFDVMLLDWDANVSDGPCPVVSRTFSRPVITLGVAGAMICEQWDLKMRYS